MSKVTRRSVDASPPPEQHGAEGKAEVRQSGMSAADAARYVAEFSAELSYLAREANLDLLAYLLDMARLEAIRTLQMGMKDR
jgi:hypothetical protein